MPMKIRSIGKILVIMLIVSAVFTQTAQPVSAQLSLAQLHIDSSITLQDSAYSVPTQIVIVPIFPPSADFNVRSREWFRGLYYYSIANARRPGFTDIPFHYVVTKEGDVFSGNSGGEERKISVTGIGDSAVVIAYLAGKSDNSIDPRASEALGDLILDVANKNSIQLDKVSITAVKYERNDEQKTISITKQNLYGLWNTSLKALTNSIKKQYKPVAKSYSVDIKKLELPTKEVKPGQTIIGKITVVNTSKYGFYPDTISELVGTKTQGATSIFYTPEFWVSTSQFSLLAQDRLLLPTKQVTYEFRLTVPLYFGQQVEKFELRTTGGQVVKNSGFKVNMNVGRPAGITVLEIAATQTGWLRVRASASGAAAEIGRVSTGERYIRIADSGNGWYKIKLTTGEVGWISRQYVKIV